MPSLLQDGFDWVYPCLTLIAQHGEDALRYFLHHGLLDKTVNILYDVGSFYTCCSRRKCPLEFNAIDFWLVVLVV